MEGILNTSIGKNVCSITFLCVKLKFSISAMYSLINTENMNEVNKGTFAPSWRYFFRS